MKAAPVLPYQDPFPYRAFRTLGAIQITIGLIFLLTGSISIGLYLAANLQVYNPNGTPYSSQFFTQTTNVILLIGSSLLAGYWFIITGSLGAAVARNRQAYLPCLKVAFLVMSVISVLVVTPAVGAGLYMAGLLLGLAFTQQPIWIVAAVLGGLAFIQWIVCIVAAAMCCCCAKILDPEEREMINMETVQMNQGYNHPRM